MKPREFAEVYAAGRAQNTGEDNAQTRFAALCRTTRQKFDELVEGRDSLVVKGHTTDERVFQPFDLGSFAVGPYLSPHLFAQLSLQYIHPYNKPGKIVNHIRAIGVYNHEDLILARADSGWQYVYPRFSSQGAAFIGRLTLDDSRWRAIPSSVALTREFADTLDGVIEAVGVSSLQAQQLTAD